MAGSKYYAPMASNHYSDPEGGKYDVGQRKKATFRHNLINILTTIVYLFALFWFALPALVRPSGESLLRHCLSENNVIINSSKNQSLTYEEYVDLEHRDNGSLVQPMDDVNRDKLNIFYAISPIINLCFRDAVESAYDAFASLALGLVILTFAIFLVFWLLRFILMKFLVKKLYTQADWNRVQTFDRLLIGLWFLLACLIALFYYIKVENYRSYLHSFRSNLSHHNGGNHNIIGVNEDAWMPYYQFSTSNISLLPQVNN